MSPPARNAASPDVLTLDLGGVLADLGDPVRSMGLDVTAERFWDIWLSSPAVRAYESGGLSTGKFAADMASELGLPSATAFMERFARWRLTLFPGAEGLIRRLSLNFRLALLSNTSDLHWQQIRSETAVFEEFDRLFLSFETGHCKPETVAFEQVLEHYQCRPGGVIFLDDSETNVRAATGLGIRAARVAGPKGVERALRSFRVL